MLRRKEATRRNVIYVINEREEEYVYYKNQEANLSIRSMFMEDINYVTKLNKLSFKDKRALKRTLEKQDSEIQYFVIEEMNLFKGSIHGTVATAELKSNGDIYVDAYLSLNNNKSLDNFKANILLERLYVLLRGFFNETNNTESCIYIRRAV